MIRMVAGALLVIGVVAGCVHLNDNMPGLFGFLIGTVFGGLVVGAVLLWLFGVKHG